MAGTIYHHTYYTGKRQLTYESQTIPGLISIVDQRYYILVGDPNSVDPLVIFSGKPKYLLSGQEMSKKTVPNLTIPFSGFVVQTVGLIFFGLFCCSLFGLVAFVQFDGILTKFLILIGTILYLFSTMFLNRLWNAFIFIKVPKIYGWRLMKK